MKTKITSNIGLAAIAMALFFAAAFLAHGATITVTNTNDSGAGSLRHALIDASDGDTITFAVTGTIVLTSGELLVNKSITISGPGAASLAVDGNLNSRVFHIGIGKTVTISGLTITNGYGDGGGIYNDQATLTLSNCAISGNGSSTVCCDEWCSYYCEDRGNGGGIYSYRATLTLSDCTVSNNSGNIGGGIFNNAEAGSSSLLISNSVLSGNSAYEGAGDVYNIAEDEGSSAYLQISSSTLSGNSGGNGGAIHNSAGPGNAMLEISNSTLSDNSANNGGAIWNGAAGDGAADLEVSNSRITNNFAAGGGGGIAIWSQSSAVMHMGIINSTFSGNSATGGGGIYSEGHVGVDIVSSTFSTNSASSTGGAIFSNGTNPGMDIINSTFSGNWAYYNGAGVYNGNVNLTISNSTFNNNSAGRNGGGIYNALYVHIGNTAFKAGATGENIFNYSGSITSLGYNLSSDDAGGVLTGPGDQINTDPMLGPLQDNGGPTFTHELLAASPATNAGDPNFTPPPFYDQRGPGFDRVRNGRLDIGSFELQSAPLPTPTPSPTATATPTPTSTPTPTATPTPTPRGHPHPTPRPR